MQSLHRIFLSFAFFLFSVTWATKADAQTWAYTYNNAFARSFALSQDGGYLIAAERLLKIDSSGSPVWAKSYQLSPTERMVFSLVRETSDGGYISARSERLVKLDSFGSITIQKSYPNPITINPDNFNDVVQTADGGYAAAGDSSWTAEPFKILKVDENLNVQWHKSYYVSGALTAVSIDTTDNGGFYVAGNINPAGAWIMKLDSEGTILWQKTFGNRAEFIRRTSDGGAIVAGSINSDVWIFKLDSNGNIQWQKSYGGKNGEGARTIEQTVDGGYIVGADTVPNGFSDYLVLKLSSTGSVQWKKTFGYSTGEHLYEARQTVDGGYIAVGEMNNAAGFLGGFVVKMDANGASCIGG